MKSKALQFFTLVWLICSVIISLAILLPVWNQHQESGGEAPPLSGHDPAEMALQRIHQRYARAARRFPQAVNPGTLPPLKTVRDLAAREKVAWQIRALPPSGEGAVRRVEMRAVARGSVTALAQVLGEAQRQFAAANGPLIGIDSWSLQPAGKQQQLDLSLWTMIAPAKR